jgi:hypothetical protein
VKHAEAEESQGNVDDRGQWAAVLELSMPVWRASYLRLDVQAHARWCLWCESPVLGRAQRARFCSKTCARAHWREREREQRAALRALDTCIQCDGSMAGKNWDATFCSIECKNARKRERNRIRLQTPAACEICQAALPGRRADCRACPGSCSRTLIYRKRREVYLERRRQKRKAAIVVELPRVPDAPPLAA